MCTRKVKVTMAKRLARGSYDKENYPDLDDFKSAKKSKTVKRFGSPTSESRKVKVTMAKRLARGSDDKENDPDLDDFKSSKKSKTVKRFGSPTSESKLLKVSFLLIPKKAPTGLHVYGMIGCWKEM